MAVCLDQKSIIVNRGLTTIMWGQDQGEESKVPEDAYIKAFTLRIVQVLTLNCKWFNITENSAVRMWNAERSDWKSR